MLADKLRIGITVEDLPPPAWIARVIRDIQGSSFARIVVVVRGKAADANVHPLVRLYDIFDERVFGAKHDPFAREEVSNELANIPIVDSVGTLELDVMLELGARSNARARFGVWSYRFGDAREPSGLLEVLSSSPVTTSALIMRDGAETRVLYESWSGTDPMSARRNRAKTYWKSSAFVLRALREVHELGSDALAGKPRRELHTSARSSTSELVRGLGKWSASILTDRVRRAMSRKQWLLAYGIDGTSDVPMRELEKLTWIVPPADRFWADPFVAPHGDGWIVFFEEKLYERRDAVISAFSIDRDGTPGEPFVVLETDHHLSYPFVFEWDGAWWMIPESARNGTVGLWRATDFPRRWTPERTLLRGVHAVDASVFEHDGRWWMFCNIGEPHASKDDELHLFHAVTPLGPWSPHPKNPIKSDIRSARPAGRPFLADGAWHRPAQDCSGSYGSAIVLHRIEELSETEFAETEVTRLTPWNSRIIGLHTINAAAGLTVVDLRVWRSRVSAFERYAPG